eukprot:6353808-Prymnesium_polylepis.1
MDVSELIALNESRFPQISARSKLLEGTELQLFSEEERDIDHQPEPKDTPRVVAARHGLPLDALLAINKGARAARVARVARVAHAAPSKTARERVASQAPVCPAPAASQTLRPPRRRGRRCLRVGARALRVAGRFEGVKLKSDTPLKGQGMLLRDRESEAEVYQVAPSLLRSNWWREAEEAAGGSKAAAEAVAG